MPTEKPKCRHKQVGHSAGIKEVVGRIHPKILIPALEHFSFSPKLITIPNPPLLQSFACERQVFWHGEYEGTVCENYK